MRAGRPEVQVEDHHAVEDHHSDQDHDEHQIPEDKNQESSVCPFHCWTCVCVCVCVTYFTISGTDMDVSGSL